MPVPLSIDFPHVTFFGIPDLKLCYVIFTVFLIELLSEHSTPQTITVYQDIAISLMTEFLAVFLTGLLQTTF